MQGSQRQERQVGASQHWLSPVPGESETSLKWPDPDEPEVVLHRAIVKVLRKY